MATSSFGRAFAAARKAGKKTFTWNGKKYTTELRKPVSEKLKGKKVPTPKARPDRKTPPSVSREGVTSDDLAGKPKRKSKVEGGTGVARKGSPIDRAAKTRKALGKVSNTGKTPVPTPKPTPAQRKKDIGNPLAIMDRSAKKSDPMHRATQDMQRRQQMEKHTRTGNRQPAKPDPKKKKRRGILSILGF